MPKNPGLMQLDVPANRMAQCYSHGSHEIGDFESVQNQGQPVGMPHDFALSYQDGSTNGNADRAGKEYVSQASMQGWILGSQRNGQLYWRQQKPSANRKDPKVKSSNRGFVNPSRLPHTSVVPSKIQHGG
eukprot:CAMPEP_0197457922 /NCGR_PEP_ID=MMETSP1175-20131217/47383_1 /TAXON_ID=1003142 /ORGANISM="Triceratium dubium, Strain CCMP147" /LENGTH=129 /DNA_ID=CAMNT_0042992419 /DNA_START=529 /DNA_END=918 /DNA_ORIENTATION=+